MGPNGSGKSTLAHALMGRGDYDVTGGSRHDRRRGAARPARPGSARSAGCSSRCSTRSRCPACRSRPSSARRRGGERSRAPAVDARSRARSACRPSCSHAASTTSSPAARRSAPRPCSSRCCSRSSRCSTRSTPASTSTRCATSPAGVCTARRSDDGLGVLAITHYARLLAELRPDRVHVFLAGRIVKSGGPELADELERTGYEGIAAELGIDELTVEPPAPRRPVRRPDDGPTPSPIRSLTPVRSHGRCCAE